MKKLFFAAKCAAHKQGFLSLNAKCFLFLFAMLTFSIVDVQGQKPTNKNVPLESEDAVVADCACVTIAPDKVKLISDGYIPDCKPMRFQFELCNMCDKKTLKPYKINLYLPIQFVLTNANGFVQDFNVLPPPCGDIFLCSKKYSKMVNMPTGNDEPCFQEFVEGMLADIETPDCPIDVLDPKAKNFFFKVNFEDVNKNFTGCNTDDIDPPDCLIDGNTEIVNFIGEGPKIVSGNATSYGTFFTSCSTQLTAGNLTIFVKDDLTFSGSPNVQLDFCLKGQKIVIAPNKKIIVKNANLDLISCQISGCDQMWNSITVEDGGRIITNAEKGLVPMTIRDGMFALQTKVSNATISIQRTDFTDNYISVLQDGNQNSFVDNSTFKGSGKLLPAPIALDDIPYTGILTLNDAEMQVTQSTFSNMANTWLGGTTTGFFANSKVSNMKKASYLRSGYGIFINNGTQLRELRTTKNNFTKCETATIRTDYANTIVQDDKISSTPIGVQIASGEITKITNNTFDAADFGVKIWGSKKLKLNILNNTFKNGNEKGIELWFNSYAEKGLIKGNTMTLNGDAAIESYNAGTMGKSFTIEQNPTISLKGTNAIKLQGSPHDVNIQRNPDIQVQSGTSGINIQGGTQNTAFCNVINPKSSFSGFNNSISNKFIITCNTINTNTKGFHFDGVCKSLNAFAGNSMNGGMGLSVGSAGIMDEQKYQGNLWFGSGAENTGSFKLSPFTVYTGAPLSYAKNFKPDPLTPTQWFEDIPTGPNQFQNICPSGTCAKTNIPPVPPRLSDGDIKILSDGSYQTPNLPPSKWMEKRELYFRLKEDTDLIKEGGSDAQKFVNITDENALGGLYITYKKMQTLFEENQTEIANSEAINTAIEAQNTSLESVNDALINQVSKELLLKKQEIIKQLNILRAQRDEQNEQWQKAVNERINDAELSNEAIELTNILESNERNINALYFKAIAKDSKLNEEEISTLAHIALQCPYQGGEAVYRARSLYALYDNFKDYNDDDCSKYQVLTRVEANRSVDASLFPNPANSELRIEMPKEYASSKIEVVFLNSFNQIVQRNSVLGIDIIDTSKLTDGIYTCLLYNQKDNALLSTQKIIIIK